MCCQMKIYPPCTGFLFNIKPEFPFSKSFHNLSMHWIHIINLYKVFLLIPSRPDSEKQGASDFTEMAMIYEPFRTEIHCW